MTLTAEKIVKPVTYQAKYHLNGESKFSGCKYKEAEKRLPVARELRNYFEEGINKFPGKGNLSIGVGPGTALLEIAVALGLAVRSPSAATVVNAITSGGELVETIIGGTHILETERERDVRLQIESEADLSRKEELKKKLEEYKSDSGKNLWDWNGKGTEQRAEMVISSVQLGAGVAGGLQTILGLVSKLIKGENAEEKSLSILDKLFFSSTSLLNGALMLFASGEKTLLASLIENRGLEDGNKKIHEAFEHGNSIRSNGRSDFRCFMEWVGMSFFTWFKDIKLGSVSVKDVFDIGISSLAVWNGSEYFRNFGKEEKTSSKTLMENIFSYKSIMSWYLSSFREKFVSPLIALTGYKPPEITTIGDEVSVKVFGSEESLVSSEPVLPQENPPALKLANLQAAAVS